MRRHHRPRARSPQALPAVLHNPWRGRKHAERTKHQCCETQQLGDGCATLCNASDADAMVAAVPNVEARLPLAGLVVPAVATDASAVTARILPANHSPPLYLQHAALLI